MEIYEFLHLYNEALNEINKALEMEKSKQYENEENRKSEIKYWQIHQDRIKKKVTQNVKAEKYAANSRNGRKRGWNMF